MANTRDGREARDTMHPAPVSTGRVGLAAPRRRHGLARVDEGDGTLEEYIGFRVAHEVFALTLMLVREILKPPPVTEVPRARHDVLGIVSVRGRITTVLDLRKRLGFPSPDISPASRILLVDAGREELGLLVDEVTQVYRLSSLEIEPAGSVLGGNVGSHIAGIGRPKVRGLRGERSDRTVGESSGEEVLILLDLAALLV